MGETLKQAVKEKYTSIVQHAGDENGCWCCSGKGGPDAPGAVFAEVYDNIDGYVPEADLGLGCGLPTVFAGIKEGDFVLDLGSGAGNDSFVARAIVGETGYVVGIDFTEAMIEKARNNARNRNITNVDFIFGDIEKIPVNLEVVDVVISNCVLNLVPDKAKAFAEIYRVLKQGGHFCISDVVSVGRLPEALKSDAALYAGCISGALPRDEYLSLIMDAGFERIEFNNDKKIDLPDELLLRHLPASELETYKQAKNGIFSMTITAHKSEACSCCCRI